MLSFEITLVFCVAGWQINCVKRIWSSPVTYIILLLVSTVIAYGPAIRGEFVWDDALYLRDNPLIQARDGLQRFWLTTEFTDYYALSNTSFWLEWRLWGTNPTGYHITNILLHALNALLLWQLLRQLKVRGAGWAGLAFALHPVNVMSVAWISERKNVLSLVFALLSGLAFFQWEDLKFRRWYWLAVAFFALALLSKTAVVMLPVVLLLLIWWRHGKLCQRDWLSVVPFFALSLGLGLVTMWFEQHHGIRSEIVQTAGFPGRLARAGCVVWFYLGKALWPVGLNVIYPHCSFAEGSVAAFIPLAVLVCIAVILWRYRTIEGRAALVAMGCFVTLLFPVLGFFKIGFMGYSNVADHWQYLALISVLAVVGSAGAQAADVWRWRWLSVLGVIVLLWLGWGTWQRAHVWQSELQLWSDTLQKNPDAWMAHNNLGNALLREGRIDAAIAQYQSTIRLRPDYANAHYNLGIATYQNGRPADAVRQFREVIRLKPQAADAHNNLGAVLVNLGNTNEAIAEFKTAVRLAPRWSEPRANLSRIGVRSDPDSH